MPNTRTPASRYQDWLHLRVALVSCYRGKPGLLSGPQSPRGLTAWRIYRGRARVTIGQQTVSARAGEWLLPRPLPRITTFSEDIDLLSLNFYAQWPTGEPLFNRGLGIAIPAEHFPELDRHGMETDRVLERFVPGHHYSVFTAEMPLENYALVQQAFGRFFAAYVAALGKLGIHPAPPGNVDSRLGEAMELLRLHPLNRPMDIKAIARNVAISAVQLNRLARNHLGHTIQQQWQQQRCEYARRCLLMPRAQVKEISLSLGFASLSHFSRWFRRMVGISPRQFRDHGGEF